MECSQASPPPDIHPEQRSTHLSNGDVIMALPEYANGGEALNEVGAAQLRLKRAVHLGKADAAVPLRVLVVHLLGRGLPGGLQPLAPVAPRGVEVDHD